jgi:hypothetical protein
MLVKLPTFKSQTSYHAREAQLFNPLASPCSNPTQGDPPLVSYQREISELEHKILSIRPDLLSLPIQASTLAPRIFFHNPFHENVFRFHHKIFRLTQK